MVLAPFRSCDPTPFPILLQNYNCSTSPQSTHLPRCQTTRTETGFGITPGRNFMSQAPVRDFIYLDVERIRSFVAQASGGLTSELTRQAEHQVGGEGGASGGLPFLATVSGKAEYHYLTSQMETKSLHDQIFQEFY